MVYAVRQNRKESWLIRVCFDLLYKYSIRWLSVPFLWTSEGRGGVLAAYPTPGCASRMWLLVGKSPEVNRIDYGYQAGANFWEKEGLNEIFGAGTHRFMCMAVFLSKYAESARE